MQLFNARCFVTDNGILERYQLPELQILDDLFHARGEIQVYGTDYSNSHKMKFRLCSFELVEGNDTFSLRDEKDLSFKVLSVLQSTRVRTLLGLEKRGSCGGQGILFYILCHRYSVL